jgi:hypothetical protein
MESQYRKLKIDHLNAHLQILRMESQSISNRIEVASTHQEKASLFSRWDRIMKLILSLQFTLDCIEEQESEV